MKANHPNAAFRYNYDILPSDWKDFKKKILKIKTATSKIEKMSNDMLDTRDWVFDKVEKKAIARYDREELEVFTDLTKREFYTIVRMGITNDRYDEILANY